MPVSLKSDERTLKISIRNYAKDDKRNLSNKSHFCVRISFYPSNSILVTKLCSKENLS